LIFATYQNAGVRVFDVADPLAPREVAHFAPPAPEKMVDPRPNRLRVIESNDVYVAPDGLMYGDRRQRRADHTAIQGLTRSPLRIINGNLNKSATA
jgi:hypothetical protein